jgi:hypothetical protein
MRGLLGLGSGVRLGVQVVRVEGEDVFHGLLVGLVHEVLVGSLLMGTKGRLRGRLSVSGEGVWSEGMGRRTYSVPRVEGVVSDHVESSLGKGGLLLEDHVLGAVGKEVSIVDSRPQTEKEHCATYHVLIMSPGNHGVLKPAVGGIDPVFRRVSGVVEVGIDVEGVGSVGDLVLWDLAADDKGISDHVPLAL